MPKIDKSAGAQSEALKNRTSEEQNFTRQRASPSERAAFIRQRCMTESRSLGESRQPKSSQHARSGKAKLNADSGPKKPERHFSFTRTLEANSVIQRAIQINQQKRLKSGTIRPSAAEMRCTASSESSQNDAELRLKNCQIDSIAIQM